MAIAGNEPDIMLITDRKSTTYLFHLHCYLFRTTKHTLTLILTRLLLQTKYVELVLCS